jgi:hypothetical protein
MTAQVLRRVFLAVVLVAALSWLLYGPLRPLFVAPLLQAYQSLQRFYQVIPQTVFWLIFVLVVYIMAATGWARLAGDWLLASHLIRRNASAVSASPEGRVVTLARWVRRQPRGPFSRHYLKTIVSEIAIESLAQAHRVSPAQIKTALKANALDLPPEINAYLLAGLSPWPLEPLGSLRQLGFWLGPRPPVAPADTELERVLQFLENMP